MKNRILLILFLLHVITANAQLYTKYSQYSNISSLVQNLFASPNVQITNVSFNGYYVPATGINGDIRDIGFFNSQSSTVGIDSGIVLTSGLLDPQYGLGQPASVAANHFKPTNGDSLLNTLINYPTYFTSGAAVLEFDFIPNGDSIKFEYVFASDEYPQQLCIDDNDIFAFFISGPGITGIKNIALVPNSTLPVCIKSINDTSIVPYSYNISNCYSVSNSQYYVNHLSDTNFIYNGSTTVLTARERTIPCQTYHMKFAIAEVGSIADNSAVFLKANSFNSEPIKITSLVSYANGDTALYEACSGAKLIIRRTYNLQNSKTYNVNISGSATNGTDYNTLPLTITMQPNQMYDTIVLQPIMDFISDNLETVTIKIGDTLCNGNYYEDEIRFVIVEKNNLKIEIEPNIQVYCDTANFTLNILNNMNPMAINWFNGSHDSILSYFPNSFNNGYYTQIPIWVTVSDGCGQSSSDTINTTFSKKPVADFEISPYFIEALLSEVTFINTSSIDAIKYQWYSPDYNLLSNEKDITYTFPDSGSYYTSLYVSNKFNCVDSITKKIIINEPMLVYIPNSFSPNDDNLNDTFKPYIPAYKSGTLEVFNRWGELVFSTHDLETGWNGKFKNFEKTSQIDTYTYKLQVIFINGLEKKYNGIVTLLK